jgi:RHS repeat-associated protein
MSVTKYYRFNGDRIAMRRNGVLTYLHSDHLGSVMLATDASGNAIGDHGYAGYGKYRLGSELSTEHRFTGQKSDGTNLQYFNARYYDPELGTFISPDTFVPDPTIVFDYNRYMFARGNPMKYNDPTGHATSKPDWWPDVLPYVFDLPDGMTEAQFIEWLAENNIPTTWGVQAGGDATMAPYVGTTASLELAYMFNWLSGEVMLTYNASGGGYLGFPDVGFGGHAGAVFVAGASRIDTAIVGLSDYTTVAGELEAVTGELGVSGTWSRAVNNLGDENLWVAGKDFIDPRLDRTVDALNINVNAGVDVLSIPIQHPPVPFDIGMSYGYAQTSEIVAFNLYSPFQAVWNWIVGD